MTTRAVSVTSQNADDDAGDARWSLLYKMAGVAAAVAAVVIPIQIAIFILWPPPGFDPSVSTVTRWFAMFHDNRLLGLLNLDLLIIIDEVLAIPMIFALYFALRRTGESIMLITTALFMVSVACFFAANPAFAMLSLSDQYAAAATEAQRSLAISAGQMMLATYQGTASQMYYFLGAVGLLIISFVMLRSDAFSRATAYVGIAANAIALGLYVPTIGIYISVFSVVILEVWYIMLVPRFFRLSQSAPGQAAPQG